MNTMVRKIEVPTQGVSVHTDEAELHADQVILACPAKVAQDLFPNPGEHEKQLLDTPYSSTLTVSITTDPSWSPPAILDDVYGILVPGKERRVIAAISNETNKCRDRAKTGLLFNIMPDGASGARLLTMSDDDVTREIYPELEQFMPGITGAVTSMSTHRWKNAEPGSPVGRSRLVDTYRKTVVKDSRILLAGDYMGMPFTEGAAESGLWAANRIAGGIED
jgi:oxygen-dependent protoporphyrinogen oxidase